MNVFTVFKLGGIRPQEVLYTGKRLKVKVERSTHHCQSAGHHSLYVTHRWPEKVPVPDTTSNSQCHFKVNRSIVSHQILQSFMQKHHYWRITGHNFCTFNSNIVHINCLQQTNMNIIIIVFTTVVTCSQLLWTILLLMCKKHDHLFSQ